MKLSGILLLVVGLMALATCGDTASPEPAIMSDSANATDLNASATASAQATSAAQPVAASAPDATTTPVPTASHTPVPAAPTSKSYYDLGKESLAKEEIDSAITKLSRAIELNPDYVDAYYLRGLAYAGEGDYDKGIADFEKVAELDPNHIDAEAGHADVYAARGSDYALKRDFERAIVDFEKATKLDPDNADARIGVASALLMRGITHYSEGDRSEAFVDLGSAISNFEKAIDLHADNTEAKVGVAGAYFMRGIIYNDEGFVDRAFADFDRGIGDYEEVIELDPNNVEVNVAIANAYLIRGIVYSGEGEYNKAFADFERIIEQDPGNTDIEEVRRNAQKEIAKIEFERSERIEWSPCEDGLRCGFVQVPADYRDPDAGSIRIAVNVRRADYLDERLGYLFVNPGGPGASGMELVQDSEFAFAEKLAALFDIIGFDPRRVGASEPEFACGAPGERLELLGTIVGDIDTAEETAAGEAAANLCIESMGPVGGLLHSEYVARDMDEMRKALGAERISYLGYSYGSTLGVWYATLFPESVRTMVVDGADNPVDKGATQQDRVAEAVEEWTAFDGLMKQALTACDSSECSIFNEGDPVGYYNHAVKKLYLVNTASGDLPYAGFLAMLTTLYGEETWPDLWRGLYELNENDDPKILLEFAVIRLGDDLTAPNFTAHVDCLDGLVLYPERDRATRFEDLDLISDAIAERLPLLDAIYPSSSSPCPFYDQFAPEPLDGPLDGGGVPILVVGNHGDFTTPFAESEKLALETLSNGYLLETSHPSHIVYPDNSCVNEHVHNALIEAVYPDKHVFCERED